jgi:hypothetical protein
MCWMQHLQQNGINPLWELRSHCNLQLLTHFCYCLCNALHDTFGDYVKSLQVILIKYPDMKTGIGRNCLRSQFHPIACAHNFTQFLAPTISPNCLRPQFHPIACAHGFTQSYPLLPLTSYFPFERDNYFLFPVFNHLVSLNSLRILNVFYLSVVESTILVMGRVA